jgi:hypothetical protein
VLLDGYAEPVRSREGNALFGEEEVMRKEDREGGCDLTVLVSIHTVHNN